MSLIIYPFATVYAYPSLEAAQYFVERKNGSISFTFAGDDNSNFTATDDQFRFNNLPWPLQPKQQLAFDQFTFYAREHWPGEFE